MTTEDPAYRQLRCDEDEFVILKTLLDAGGEFVSGSLLSEQLGVSRPAVWGKLEKLRSKGFDFEAVRNRGYRITQQPAIFHPALFRYAQEQIGNDTELLYFPVIDSTNNEADRQISHRRKSPFAVASSCQTKGAAVSAANGTVPQPTTSTSLFSLSPSCRLRCSSISPYGPVSTSAYALQRFVPTAALKIKWPNDLHCEGRKFAGMLTEAKIDADGLKTIVFGIGINLNSNPNEYPKELRALATSLYAIGGKELPINEVTAAVLNAIENAYRQCIEHSDPKSLEQEWASLDALEGKPVTARMGETEITGIARGIDDSGALLLEQGDGNARICPRRRCKLKEVRSLAA